MVGVAAVVPALIDAIDDRGTGPTKAGRKQAMSEPGADGGARNELSGATVGTSVQANAVHGGIHLHQTPTRQHQTPTRQRVVPRQLPGAVRHFVNRQVEQDALTTLVNGSAAEDVLLISAIDGTAGVGKSTLAVQWAHRARERFPDGELYANLRGFDPRADPMSSDEALGEFLAALDTPQDHIPASSEGRAALFRSLMHERKMLVLLDNAHSAEQVRALLPGTSDSLVLVTSRNRLDDLVVREGAARMTLEILDDAEARDLLLRYLDEDRCADEPEAVRGLVEHCAGLPLALGIVAVRAAADPDLPLDDVVAELRDERDRLDALDSGGQTGVRAVLSWSYRSLSPAAARMLRLLGLPTGPDLGLAAAADLAGVPQREARRSLAELIRANLLEQPTPGRYRCHDLLRAYASERAHEDEPAHERQAAIHRLIDHYLRTCRRIEHQLAGHSRQFRPDPPESAVAGRTFPDDESARNWWDVERANLLAAVRQASACDLHQHTWQLAYALTPFFQTRGDTQGQIRAYELGLDALEHLQDSNAQAHLRYDLSGAHYTAGDYEKAAQEQRRALELIDEVADPYWAGMVRIDLGMACTALDRQEEAATALHRGLELERTADDRNGQGYALAGLGALKTRRGDLDAAFSHLRQALHLYRQVGEEFGEGFVLHDLAEAQHVAGQRDRAFDTFRQAATHRQRIGHRRGEATTLDRLGAVLHEAGSTQQAREHWQRALPLLDALGDPRAAEVRALLESS